MDVDLLIVGAGPAGLALAAEARAAGIPADRLVLLEGAALASLDRARAIATCGLRVRYQEEVLELRGRGPFAGFNVKTARSTYQARAVAIATDLGERGEASDISVPASLAGRIHPDLAGLAVRGEHVLVVGSGDGAAAYVQVLARENRVTLSCRERDLSRMSEANRARLLELEASKRVRLRLGAAVTALADGGGLPRVTIEGRAEPLRFDRVVFAQGGAPSRRFLQSVGVTFDGELPVLDEAGESERPGLFLVGDPTGGRRPRSITSVFEAARRAATRILAAHVALPVARTPPRRLASSS